MGEQTCSLRLAERWRDSKMMAATASEACIARIVATIQCLLLVENAERIQFDWGSSTR